MPEPTSALSFLQTVQTAPETASEPGQITDRPGLSEQPTGQPSPLGLDSGRVDSTTQNPATAELGPGAIEAAFLARGHRLFVRDGRLYVNWSSRLSEADWATLKKHRQSLLTTVGPWPDDQPWPLDTPTITVGASLADLFGVKPRSDWRPHEPPNIDAADEIILNFETDGLDWAKGDKPIGVTIGTPDGHIKQFLPFGFQGSHNLDRSAVIRYLQSIRNKRIININTRFDVHMGRNIDVDFESQGCTVSDIQHWAALLDDHRKKFALDVLAKDFLGGIEVPRVDERNMAQYTAQEVAARAEYQVQLIAQLRDVLWPMLDEQGLHDVRQLEDEVIYPVVEMERNGSPIDLELLEKFHTECTARHGKLMMEISEEVGFGFEHSQTGWTRLFEKCGLKAGESFAEEVIAPIEHPLIQKARFAGQLGSLNSKTFAAYKRLIGPDGLLRYDIHQLRGDDGGTVSGRFSIGYVQQVPNHDNHHVVFGTSDIESCGGLCDLFPRRLYIPRTGDYLEADAEQIEYRFFAHFANNADVLKAYQENPRMSFHKKMWAMLKQYKADMLYTHTKSFDFAKQYGAKSIKLAVMMGMITAAEGEEIRREKRWNDPRLDQIHEIEAAFKRAMPEGDYLLDRAAHLAKSKCDNYCKKDDQLHREFSHRGFVKTILGRRSRFPNNYKTYIGLNRVLQGSASDVMKRKLVELHKARKYTGLLLRLTVHDSVTGDAQIPETKARVSEILNAQSFPQLRVPILWGVKAGRSWAECR